MSFSNVKKPNSLYEVIDNALTVADFDVITKEFFNGEVNWFYRASTTPSEQDRNKSYFTHNLYSDHRVQSDYFTLFVPLLKKLNVRALVSMRSNLCIRTHEPIASDFHTDESYDDSKTAIFYLNTCNGKTILNVPSGKVSVDCAANRLLSFNTNVLHSGQYQTDTVKRMVINMTYF